MTDGRTDVDSVGCSRSHVHNGASHVHRVRVRVRLGLGLGFVDIRVRVRVRARVTVSVRVRSCGHYVDIVAGNCGRLRLQPTVTRQTDRHRPTANTALTYIHTNDL